MEKAEEQLISMAAYASHRKCTIAAVRGAIASGRLGDAVHRRADGRLTGLNPTLADANWLANTKSEHNWRTQGGNDAYARARARRAAAAATMSEIELAVRLGQLVDAEAIAAEFGAVLRQIRDTFAGAFERAETLLSLEPRNGAIRANFRKSADEVLDLLAVNLGEQAKRAAFPPAPIPKRDKRRKRK